jgi:hypothetical protein
MQRIAQQSKRPEERIGGHVVHLRILDPVPRERGFLKLPIEMIATVLKLAEAGRCHGLRIGNGRRWAVQAPHTRWVGRYRQVLDHFRKEYAVELRLKGGSDLHKFDWTVSIPCLAM